MIDRVSGRREGEGEVRDAGVEVGDGEEYLGKETQVDVMRKQGAWLGY